MPNLVIDDPRGVSSRGLPSDTMVVDPTTAASDEAARLRALAPRTYRHPDGSTPARQDFERFSQDYGAMEREVHVWRFQKPDGTTYDTSWKGLGTLTTARAWADLFQHRLIGEVQRERWAEYPAPEPPLSAPPLVQAPPTPRRTRPISPEKRGTKDGKPKPPDRGTIEPPPPSAPEPVRPRPPVPIPPRPSTSDEFFDYLDHEFWHTTMTKSMPLIAEYFGKAGEVLSWFPLTRRGGEIYKQIAEGAEALALMYELYHEMKEADALEKGSKDVIHRVKPVKKIAEKLLAKKFPRIPEDVRKEIAKKLEELFEKYFTDPLIEKGKKRMQDADEQKDLDRTLREELRRLQERIKRSLDPTMEPGLVPVVPPQ